METITNFLNNYADWLPASASITFVVVLMVVAAALRAHKSKLMRSYKVQILKVGGLLTPEPENQASENGEQAKLVGRVYEDLKEALSHARAEETRALGLQSDMHTLKDENTALRNAISALVNQEGQQAVSALEHLRIGDVEQAKDLFLELATAKAQEATTAHKEAADAYVKLGALSFLNDTDQALRAYSKATELDPDNAKAWNQLGQLQKRTGRLTEAEESYNRVLFLSNRSNDKKWEAIAFTNLGIIAETRGDLDKAQDFQTRALALNEELGRKEGMANTLGNLGNIAETRGDLDKAQDFQIRALALNEELGRKEGMANTLGNLGNIAKARGDLDTADELQTRALAIEEELGRKEGIAATLGNLGLIAKTRSDLDKAQDFQTRALALNEELGRKEGIAATLGNLGSIAKTRGDLDKARALWSQARDLFAEIGMPHMVERLQGWIDSLDDKNGD